MEPTWPQLGFPNRPKFDPRAIQNPVKIVSYFWYTFGSIFCRFRIQFGAQNHPKIHPKITSKASQQANNEKSTIAKSACVVEYLRALGYLYLGAKTIKNQCNNPPKLASKTMPPTGSILHQIWLHFGTVLAPKLGSSWHQNALKTEATTHQKIYHILDSSWKRF